MDEVSNICLDNQWDNLIDNCIPMHKWDSYLKKKLAKRVKEGGKK